MTRAARSRRSTHFNQPSRSSTVHHLSASARAARIGKKHPHKGAKGHHTRQSLHLKHRQRG